MKKNKLYILIFLLVLACGCAKREQVIEIPLSSNTINKMPVFTINNGYAMPRDSTAKVGSSTVDSVWRHSTTTDDVYFSSLTNCDTIDTDANGLLSCGTDASGAGGGSNWIYDTNYGVSVLTASTTIPVWFKDAVYASSTLTVDGLTTLVNASTTQLTVSDNTYLNDDVYLKDNKKVYFSANQTNYLAYDTNYSMLRTHDTGGFNGLAASSSMYIYSNAGDTGGGQWDPNLQLLTDGTIRLQSITGSNRDVEITGTDYIVLTTGNTGEKVRFLTSYVEFGVAGGHNINLETWDSSVTGTKTFRFPNLNGTFLMATGTQDILTTGGATTTSLAITNMLNCNLDTDGSGNLVCGTDAGGNTAWDDIGNPDANDEIDFGAYETELNVENFRIGDGGSNYFQIIGNGSASSTGNLYAATYGSDGTVSDAELLYINSLSSNAQTQLNSMLTLSVWFATTTHTLINSLPALATVGTITSGTWQGTAIDHERGGLEADVNAYTGLIAISGGNTSEVDAKSELEAQIADVADFAEADGDAFTNDYTFDTDVLVINATTDRVGIGSSTPTYDLSVGSGGSTSGTTTSAYFRLPNGYCMYEDTSTSTPNLTLSASPYYEKINNTYNSYFTYRVSSADSL